MMVITRFTDKLHYLSKEHVQSLVTYIESVCYDNDYDNHSLLDTDFSCKHYLLALGIHIHWFEERSDQ